jgi:hypothetical protein
MAAAVPVAPVPPAPSAAPSGAQNLRPVAQRRSPVPFVAVGAGVLLLILAAIFGPGLLAGRSGNGGSPTPAATAPATAAAAPSATSGLPLGAVTGSETPGVASPTPAQGAGEPTVATTEPPSAIPAPAAPTEAATAVMDMPTPAAIPPTTNEGAVGVVRFTDDGQHVVDQVVVSITLSTLSAPPAGQGRVAWLVNSTTGASLNLGRVTPNAQGAWTQTYTDTQQANLLASYDGFLVTNEALDTTPFAPSSDIVLRGQLPVQALVHIAHLLVSYPDTPNQVALEVGLRAQVDALITHAQQLSTAQATSNLANVKREAEAIANLIAGAKAPGFGDLDKDGLIQTAGDGFGLLQNSPQDGYLLGVKDHAELSAAAADATDNVKQHASGVAITTDNVQVWATQILDKARAIISADNPTVTRPLVADILGLATYIEQGQAIGTDGNIRPVKGSGGAITSYQEALGMAAIPIQPAK